MTRFLSLAFLLSILTLVSYTAYEIFFHPYQGPDQNFQIHPGDGLAKINYRLYKNNLNYSPAIFHRYVKFKGYQAKFKVGQFLIKNQMNMHDIIDLLVNGQANRKKITITEGKNLYEIAQILHDQKIVNKEDFIKSCFDPRILKKFHIPYKTVEGHLYPDTYEFHPQETPLSIIEKMISNFNQKTKNLDYQNNPHKLPASKLLILASIIEKETGAGHERALISGVFHNRLKKRMRLQSDPTTIYGLMPNFNGNLRKRDLQKTTPYNTYRIYGLPIGPIANPGQESLYAAIHPAQHSYLYFVSKNDGTHLFSRNYKEHRRAVYKYQKYHKQK